MKEAYGQLKLFIYGVAVGLAYGLTVRYMARLWPDSPFFGVMSVSFVFLLPLCMGFLAVFVVERRQKCPPGYWVLLSMLSVGGGLLGTMAVLWEGMICVVMFAPIGLGCGMIGGAIGGLLGRYSRNLSFACIALLPILANPYEGKLLSRCELRTVETSIDIQAPTVIVWDNLKSVSTIRPAELTRSWSRQIGFPRPLDATLSREGVGGIRHARFEGGVLFIETVDAWDPGRRLAFSIRAQTSQIPSGTLDSHVTVGGPFFDVLRGQYVIEPLPNGFTRLHLSSEHRLSTDFNWYAHLWTDAVMRDIQDSILHVLRRRCESESTTPLPIE